MSVIFENVADSFESGEITLNTSQGGCFLGEVSVVFNTPGGSVAVLVYSPERDGFIEYSNMTITDNTLKQICLYGTNKIKIKVTDGATDVTVEVV